MDVASEVTDLLSQLHRIEARLRQLTTSVRASAPQLVHMTGWRCTKAGTVLVLGSAEGQPDVLREAPLESVPPDVVRAYVSSHADMIPPYVLTALRGRYQK